MSQQPRRIACRSLPGAHILVHESMDGLEDAWRSLAERSNCHVFQTWEWNAAWFECIGRAAGVKPRIVQLVDARDQILALWPLGLYRRGALRVLAFLGDVVSDYRAPLLAPGFADSMREGEFARVWRECERAATGGDLVALERMPARLDSCANPMAALPGAIHTENAHAARLPASVDAYMAQRSKQLLAALRRKVRRLSDSGELTFTPAHDRQTESQALAAVIRLKSRRWRETGSRDLFAEPAYLAFYRTLTERYGHGGMVSLCSLKVGDTIVAAQWGMVLRGRYYWILPGYETGEWLKRSCGQVLLHRMLEWSIDSGLQVFDMTVGDEAYKKDWANEQLALYSWYRARTPLGWAFLLRRRLDAAARRIPWLRRWGRAVKRTFGTTPGRPPADTSE